MLRRAALLFALTTTPLWAQTAAPEPSANPQPPLSDIPKLILDVERNQKAAEAIQNNYVYRIHRVSEDFSKDGKVKKTTVVDADSLTIDGVRVNRETARDGKPLTPEEAKKENERIDKDVAKAKERRAKAEDKGRDTDARGDEMISASRILELGTFSNPRRESIDGRDTIAVDYAGDPKAKTRNAGETVIRDLAGTVWIDEKDRTMVRAEGHFANDFKVGGGLVADIHKGTHFSFRAQKVNGEVWLPATIEGRGSARMMLFLNFNGAMELTASDYRKFRTTSNIVGTNGVIGADGQPVPAGQPVPDPPAPPQPAVNPKP
jgi:hypothetical protein